MDDEERPGQRAIGVVEAVSVSPTHSFSKQPQPVVTLVVGLGVSGDAHRGMRVQHRSRVARDPTQPNLRQVHLIHAELFDDLAAAGFGVQAGQLGENVTTRGIALLSLPTGTRLRLGPVAVVAVTGLRDPCRQIDGFCDGLLKQVIGRDAAGNVVRKAGVMSVVLVSGQVRAGDVVVAELPAQPYVPLQVV